MSEYLQVCPSTYDGGDDKEHEVIYNNPSQGSWISYDIPFTSFTNLTTRANLAQLLFISSGSTVYVDNVFFWANNPLPITLSEFSAAKDGNKTKLTWSTLTETNNKGFNIQRSLDAKSWETIHYVSGVGNASIKTNYSAIDESPIKGTNFYRLEQMDLDGKKSYSTVVSVRFADKESVGLSFFPNPTKDKVVIIIDKIESNKANLEIINMQGKVLKTISLTDQQSNSNLLVDVNNFSKGMYLIKLNNGSTIKTSKLIIN